LPPEPAAGVSELPSLAQAPQTSDSTSHRCALRCLGLIACCIDIENVP
jgi:hypothetical protein